MADARIHEIFSKNARTILGFTQAWHIHSFGVGNYQFYDSHQVQITPGLIMLLYDEGTPCSVETLKNAYDQVLEKLSTGWTWAKPEENSDIFHKKEPSDFHLFIKHSKLSEEDTIIRFLASKFDLREHVDCNNV